MLLTGLSKHRDAGLLFMRLGLGIMFVVVHGWPKLLAGPERWTQVGSAMSHLGISFFPEVWGLLASLAEFGGGILLILGFLFRPATIALAFTMAVAAWMKYQVDGTLFAAAHPLELFIVFFALIFVGPGRYSLDRN